MSANDDLRKKWHERIDVLFRVADELDTCHWVQHGEAGWWQTECNNTVHISTSEAFKFCPFCGLQFDDEPED